MWSWLKGDSRNADADDDVASKASFISDSKGEGDGKYKRISKSWVENPATKARENALEGKTAQHNLLNRDDPSVDQECPVVSSSFLSHSRSTARRFESFLEPKRISSRPIYIVRQSDSDILRFNEDNFNKAKRQYQGKYISIPILPADEMNSLTSEIKLWHKNRKNFKITFSIAVICGVIIFGVSFSFTVLWYANHDFLFFQSQHFTRTRTQFLNLHMNAQVLSLMFMAVGVNIFRVLPETKLTKAILYHILILSVGVGISILGVSQAIESHSDFLELDPDSHSHFYSIHSWIGIAAYILLIKSFLSGFYIMYYPTSKLRVIHARFAVMGVMLCGASAITGFFYRALLQFGPVYTQISIPGAIINACGLLTLIFCMFVRMSAVNFVYRRRPKPQWDVIVYRSMEAIEDIYLELHDMYDSFEMWVKQVNQARLKALRVPHSSIRSSLAESEKSAPNTYISSN